VRADPPEPAPQHAGAARVPEPGTLPPGLAGRLIAAGISDLGDPVAAWRRLREAEGQRATAIDLYWLAARNRLGPAPVIVIAWAMPGAWPWARRRQPHCPGW
jgi:hypothetical protein